MSSITALYRYPVKGLSAETLDRASILDTGTVAGDRILGLLFADAGPAVEDGWWPKDRFTVLMNTPALARLRAHFDATRSRISIVLDESTLVDEPLNESGRRRIAEVITEYVLGLDENPLRNRPDRAPLRLVGDINSPMFHDGGAKHITLMGRASVNSLAEAAGQEIDERRFRMNLVLDNIEPWEELTWIGHTIRVGGLDFDVTGPVVRCVATHANPENGNRDINAINLLTSAFGQAKPTMGVLAVLRGSGGKLEVGDRVTVMMED